MPLAWIMWDGGPCSFDRGAKRLAVRTRLKQLINKAVTRRWLVQFQARYKTLYFKCQQRNMKIVLILTVWLWRNPSEGYISKIISCPCNWGKALHSSAEMIFWKLGNFDT